MNCVYEQLANGVSVVHDDPGNYRRNATGFRENRARYQGQQPRTRIAVFHSKLTNCFVDGSWDPEFMKRCVELRGQCDFEILDEDMIVAGGLEHIDLLISFGGLVDGNEPADTVRRWINCGGTLLEELAPSQPQFGFETLATATETEVAQDFSFALREALSNLDAIPGVPWGLIKSGTPGVFVTAFDRELLAFNTALESGSIRLGEKTIAVKPQSIVSIPPEK